MKITLDTKTIGSINQLLGSVSSDSEVEFRLGNIIPGKFVSGVTKPLFSKLLEELKSQSIEYKKVESVVTYYRNSDTRKIKEGGKTTFQYKKKEDDVDISFSNIDVRLSSSIEKRGENTNYTNLQESGSRKREKNIFSFDGFDIELSVVYNNLERNSGITFEVEAEFTRKISRIEELVIPLKTIFNILFPDRFYMIPKEDENWVRFHRESIKCTVFKPKNIKRTDILTDYSVTNKLNGVGFELFLSEKGIYMLNSTNIDKVSSKVTNFTNTILEGEWYKGCFHIFNVLSFKGKDVSRQPHRERIDIARDIFPILKEALGGVCDIEIKTFIHTKNLANDTKDIMRYIYNRYGKDSIDSNDGIMFTPNVGIPLKFKFPSTMTIDFEITNGKIVESHEANQMSHKSKVFKTRVYTRNNNELVFFDGNYKYRTGVDSTMKINPEMVVSENSHLFNKLSDGLIVECLYDKENNYFVPERIRWDKKLPNFIEVALDVYKDIIHPIKLEDLISGFQKSQGESLDSREKDWRLYFNLGKSGDKIFNPPVIENNGYFEILNYTKDSFPSIVRNFLLWIEKKGDKMYAVFNKEGKEYIEKNMKDEFKKLQSEGDNSEIIRKGVNKGECLIPMRKFHNVKKNELISKYTKDAVVLDLGFGRGGDILKYSNAKAKFVFAVEPNFDNLDEAKNRYFDKKNNYNIDIKFINCKAQETSLINEAMDYKKVDIVTSFFSLTFFFEKEAELLSLINTIAGNTKIGGYFIGTTMSGDEAYKSFKGKNKIEYPGCYKIEKFYEDDDKEELGKKIVIHLEETIVTEQVEYLVFFEIFKEKMKKRGFNLIEYEFFNPPSTLNKETRELSKLNMGFVFQRVETPEEIRVKERAKAEQEKLKLQEKNSLKMADVDKNLSFKVSYLESSLIRTGTVGDGSCFFHSILKSVSPDYSKLDRDERKEFVSKLRNKMAETLSMKKWESFGGGMLAYSRLIPRVVKYFKTNVSEILEVADNLQISKDSTTVQNYFETLLTLIPSEYVKKVSNIFKQLRTRVFEEFKNDLTKCSTWVGQEMGSVDVFEYISDYLNIDIYIIKDTTREPYKQGVDCNIRYKHRESVIVLWVGDSHYEAVGVLVGKGKIKRVFKFDDDIIVKTKKFVCD